MSLPFKNKDSVLLININPISCAPKILFFNTRFFCACKSLAKFCCSKVDLDKGQQPNSFNPDFQINIIISI